MAKYEDHKRQTKNREKKELRSLCGGMGNYVRKQGRQIRTRRHRRLGQRIEIQPRKLVLMYRIHRMQAQMELQTQGLELPQVPRMHQMKAGWLRIGQKQVQLKIRRNRSSLSRNALNVPL